MKAPVSSLREYKDSFPAMGTQVLVVVATDGAPEPAYEAIERVKALFATEEARFSRFLPNSELSMINADGGTASPSPEMWEVLNRSKRWWMWSDGMFDPTVLASLDAAGYDCAFDLLGERPIVQQAFTKATLASVEFSDGPDGKQIALRDGVRLDLGGIVKGWTVDCASCLLVEFAGSLVDAGGDIRAHGDCADGDGWPVALEDPSHLGADDWLVMLRNEAIATSGKYRRRWRTEEGGWAHHLIDPKAGRPSSTDLLAVTVTDRTAEAAEIIAKVALIRGMAALNATVRRHPSAEALAHLEGGGWRCTPGWTMSIAPRGGVR